MPTKTAVDSDHDDKRQKMKISDDLCANLICPITLELPFDPVTAADGKVYERSAIETYISEKKRALKSPVTNKKMGRTLLSSHQTKSLIETSIQHGVITGEAAEAWRERKEVESWKKAAEEGDVEAAVKLASCFYDGTNGLEEDASQAFKNWKIAADAGDLRGMQEYGYHLLEEGAALGNQKFQMEAVLLLGQASARGSSVASLHLGEMYAGKYDLAHFPRDNAMAIR
ncbi:MAG: hypothetical protein SGARI_007536, partial [Bacillariaceae sp.]